MEEPNQTNNSTATAEPRLSSSLASIDSLAARIQDMQKQLQYLVKEEERSVKNVEVDYFNSLKKLEGRINFAEQHQEMEARRQKKKRQEEKKRNVVREMREKEMYQLRKAKLSLAATKENEASFVKEISQSNQAKINSLMQRDLSRKKQVINDLQASHMSHRAFMMASRVEDNRRKEESKAEMERSRIMQKPILEKKLQELENQAKLIQSRITEQGQLRKQLQNTTSSILKLPNPKLACMLQRVNKQKSVCDVKVELLKSFITESNLDVSVLSALQNKTD